MVEIGNRTYNIQNNMQYNVILVARNYAVPQNLDKPGNDPFMAVPPGVG